MENINENVKRMVSLISAKHGEIKPLLKEEDGMDIDVLSSLNKIEGVSEIEGCKTDNFDPTNCLTNAMDKLTFNKFVKEFLPALQQAKIDTSSVPKF